MMRETLERCAIIAGEHPIAFSSFDPAPLLAGARFEFAAAAGEYFEECVPSVTLDLGPLRLLSASDMFAENQGCIPSCFCAPLGFITIASDLGGDAFSVDVTSGKVYCLSAEMFEEDGIQRGWNADFSDFLPPLPIDRENIAATAQGRWESIPAFLQESFEHATRMA